MNKFDFDMLKKVRENDRVLKSHDNFGPAEMHIYKDIQGNSAKHLVKPRY